MKKLTMWLGCALTAFAIGCGDEGSKSPSGPPPDPKAMMPDADKMKEMMEKNMSKKAAAGDAANEKKDDATEKKDDGTEKKDDATEKKDGDAGEK